MKKDHSSGFMLRFKELIFGSMRNKLIAAFLVIILVPMIIVTIYSISTMTSTAKTQMEAKLKSNSVAENLMLESGINQYAAICQNITNDNSLKMPMQMGISYQLEEYGNKIKEKFKGLDSIAIYGSDAASIYATTNDFDALVKGVIENGKPLTGILSNKGLNIISIYPVVASDDSNASGKQKVIGGVVVAHNINSDDTMFMDMSSKIGTNVLLYEGKTLVKMVDKDKKVHVPQADSDKTLTSENALKVSEYFNKSTVKLFSNNYFMDYRLIKDINGSVIGVVAVAETDHDLKTSQRNTIIIMLVILLISMVFTTLAAYGSSNLFTKPIIELKGLMKKVENGDLTVRSVNKSMDETGQLSESFNNMIDELSGIVHAITVRADEMTSVSGELEHISQTIVKDMDTIVQSMNEVMSGMESNSAGVEETTAGLQEISANASVIAKESKSTEEISDNAVQISESGKTATEDAKNSISVLMNDLEDTSGSIKELEDTTHKILEIIKGIINIESQTSLLALNATIEAARAGEAGRGFAVVAEEIKKLSGQTKEQVNKVKELIAEIELSNKKVVTEMDKSLQQSKHEVEKVNFVEKTISDVVASIDKLGSAIRKISKASESQAEATEQISAAMGGIASTTSETAACSSNVVATIGEEFKELQKLRSFIEELNDMSNDFKESINKFKL